MSRAIFVLSLPRSGSSALAGCLHRMGIDMGEGYLQVPDVLNPAGYVEDRRWQLINKQIAGSQYVVRWKEPTQGQLDAYRRLIAKCSTVPVWGVKGPRMCFTFHRITPLLEEAGVECLVVNAHREFENVVQSFKRHTEIAYGGRWPMTEDEARAHMEKWRAALQYQLGSLRGDYYKVDYDQLLAEPVTELLSLHDYCYEGLEIEGHKRIVTPALNWLDRNLRHFNADNRPDAGPNDGDNGGKSGFASGWTRKRPCSGCRGRKEKRVDKERESASAAGMARETEEKPEQPS